MPTENSVPINQHPCGTLITDLVNALSLLARHPSLKAGSLCLVQASSASRCREFLSRKPVLISKGLVA